MYSTSIYDKQEQNELLKLDQLKQMLCNELFYVMLLICIMSLLCNVGKWPRLWSQDRERERKRG